MDWLKGGGWGRGRNPGSNKPSASVKDPWLTGGGWGRGGTFSVETETLGCEVQSTRQHHAPIAVLTTGVASCSQ